MTSAESKLTVIGAGFGRTGTVSMLEALDRLGFGPCHHMMEVFAHPETAAGWAAAVRGDDVDLGALVAGYRATLDFPSCLAWGPLLAAHPDAKVLLTVRSSESWWRSFDSTIGPSMRDHAVSKEDGILELFSALSDGLFGGRSDERDPTVAVYEAHNAAVMAAVPTEQLLVYELGSGWEPLCAFLGVDVPDEPFPRSNSTEEFQANVAAGKAAAEEAATAEV